jgi:hypothetical protein
MRELLQKFIAALPRCDDCGKPATRIGDDGDYDDCTALCDKCRPKLKLWGPPKTAQGVSINGIALDGSVRWAEPLREAIKLIRNRKGQR